MKTYFITLDVQGQTEIVIKAEGKTKDEAELNALRAYLGTYDIDFIDEETAKQEVEDGVMIMDDTGEELSYEEAFGEDDE